MNLADPAVEVAQMSADSGPIGVRTIFVIDMVAAIRIRTGETGTEAL